MANKLIRADGKTVNANEDAIGFDYAFSGQSGVVAGVGAELNYDVSAINTFRILSGHAVTQGIQFAVETTDSVSLQPASGATVYYYILYYEIDLSARTITAKTSQLTQSYPQFPTSDNLKSNPFGKAYLPMYRFRQTSGGVTGIEKVFTFIDTSALKTKTETSIANIESSLLNKAAFSKNITVSPQQELPIGSLIFGSSADSSAIYSWLQPNKRVYVVQASAVSNLEYTIQAGPYTAGGAFYQLNGAWVCRGVVSSFASISFSGQTITTKFTAMCQRIE